MQSPFFTCFIQLGTKACFKLMIRSMIGYAFLLLNYLICPYICSLCRRPLCIPSSMTSHTSFIDLQCFVAITIFYLDESLKLLRFCYYLVYMFLMLYH